MVYYVITLTNSNLTMGTCSKHMDPYKIIPKVVLDYLKYSQYVFLNLGHFCPPPRVGPLYKIKTIQLTCFTCLP